ncbi:MAG: DNA gyrase inhibitor YacG [Rhodospirillales bacterium]|nr:DNA gyrase inhibitor YacG [Rhodospirillales bacterium]MDE2318072.1 DNA gyrase inhibitor YacG [Rhodospirillales bacterium]
MKCPICGKPAAPEQEPFCSKRCADIDLGHWLNDSYRLPVSAEENEEGEEN